MSVLINANGTLTRDETTAPDIPVGNRPVAVAVGDLDGDGDLDGLITNSVDGDVSVLVNANGTLTRDESTTPDIPVGNRPVAVAVGDLDGDGDLDGLITNRDDGDVSVLINTNGTLTRDETTTPDIPVGSFPAGVALGDLDGN